MELCHARTERGEEERSKEGLAGRLDRPSSLHLSQARPQGRKAAVQSCRLLSLPSADCRSLVRDFQTALGSDPYFCFLGTEQRNLEEAPRTMNINFNLWMRFPRVGKSDSLCNLVHCITFQSSQ